MKKEERLQQDVNGIKSHVKQTFHHFHNFDVRDWICLSAFNQKNEMDLGLDHDAVGLVLRY